MSYRDEYVRAVLKVLKGGDLTFDEIKHKVKEEGLRNYWLLREALLELLRSGVIEKYPDYERKKFKFRLKRL